MRTWPLRVLPALTIVFLLCGCVVPVVIPVPSQDEPYFEGKVKNLKVGMTHKDEVVYQIGDPDETYFGGSEYIYKATSESWKILWAVVVLVPGYGDTPGSGDAIGGVGTLYKRHVLILSFDEADILSKFDIETAGDDFGDCTKSDICFGAGLGYMRYSDAAADAKTKEFQVPKGKCGVYLYGPGSKGAYRVQIDNAYTNYMYSEKAFLHWTLNPGLYKVSIFPDGASFSLDCLDGEINFVHFSDRGKQPSTISLKDRAVGRKHIMDRRLVLLPSKPPESPVPTAGVTDLDPLSVLPEEARLIIIRPGINSGTLTLDGFDLAWVQQPGRFMSIRMNPRRHTLVFTPRPGQATQALITIKADAGQSYYVLLDTSSSGLDSRPSLKLLDAASGLKMAEQSEFLPATGSLREPMPLLPAVFHPSVQAPGGALVDRSSSIGAEVTIGSQTEIGAGVLIRMGVRIGEKAVIGNHVRIGKDTEIGTGVLIEQGVLIGERAVIGAGARLRLHALICSGGKVGAAADIGTNVTVQTGESVPDGARIRSVIGRTACHEP